MCGGTLTAKPAAPWEQGLSPRVRGEPSANGACNAACTVYPRVCGGTTNHPPVSDSTSGLSPRVRGNPTLIWYETSATRSIPACAGEPGRRDCAHHQLGVYPRVCGGTVCRVKLGRRLWGLSPRVRGNLRWSSLCGCRTGSIPACAGEPKAGRGLARGGWVYPRVCGGTRQIIIWDRHGGGLSPRVRGNLVGVGSPDETNGSIPACAGEPSI